MTKMAVVMMVVLATTKVMVSVLGNMLLSKNQENNEDEESVHTNILDRKDIIQTGLSLSLQSVYYATLWPSKMFCFISHF